MKIGENKKITFTFNGNAITRNVSVDSVINKDGFLYRILGDVKESENESKDFDQFVIYDSFGNEITHRAYCKQNAKFNEHGNLVSVSLGEQFRIFCEYENDLLKTCKFGNRVYYSFSYDSDNRITEYTVETKKENFIEKVIHEFEYKILSENEIIASELITDVSGDKPVFLEKNQYSKTIDRFVKKIFDSADKEIYSEIKIEKDGTTLVEQKSNTSVTRIETSLKYYCKTEKLLSGLYSLREVFTSDDNNVTLITIINTNPDGSRTETEEMTIDVDGKSYLCTVLDKFEIHSDFCMNINK